MKPASYLLVTVLVCALGPHAAGQNSVQAPLFRSVADIIQVDVSVLDDKREPVRGLVAGDFTVLENGRARPVEAFAAIDLPDRVHTADADWTRDVLPDVSTNRAGSDDGRIVVILMDRTIPFGSPTLTARKVATAAVNALGPGDLGALVSTSGGVPQNLTSDRARLIRAIGQRDWSTDVSDDAKAIEAAVGLSSDIFSNLTDPRCFCGVCVLQTITNVAEALEQMPRRRKSLLFIGSSVTFQAAPQIALVEIGCGQALEDARKVMWTALDRSGVTVHSIDPRGLEVVGPIGRASSPLRARDVSAALTSAVQKNLQDQGSLAVLPAHTGGRVVMNTNGPEEHVPAIVRESQSYYVLGFRPSQPVVPGQSRSIDVKVNRRGVRVNARRQYTVPAPPSAATSAEATRALLGSAIKSALPVADIGLAMTAGAFAAPGSANGAVAIVLDLSALAGEIAPTSAAGATFSVAVGAFDPRGRLTAAVEGTVKLPAGDVPTDRTVETLVRLDLPAGDHELRAAVTREGSGRSASVFTTVTVPPFSAVPLTLSHIAIAAQPGTLTAPRDALADLIPVVPTTRRTFARTDNAVAFMRIYQGLVRTDELLPVVVTASVVDRAGDVRLRQTLEFKPAEFGAIRAADCRFTLPVARLAPGEYLFAVEATRGERVAGRAVRFTVK